MILVVGNQKGGVGKTTTALTLAHLMHLEGDDVSILDLDAAGSGKKAGTAAAYRRATALGIPAYLLDTLPESLDGHIVVDCPPDVGNRAFAQVIEIADLVLVPTSTSLDDLEVSQAFVESLAAPYTLLFTRVHPNSGRTAEMTRKALQEDGFNVLTTNVTLYSIYADAPAIGGTVAGMDTYVARKAAKDYLAVLHEVRRLAHGQ